MDYDAIIIGCGNNGLVAAFYLARAGLRVLGLERNAKVGGACATDELIPGFHFSTCAHSFVLFHPEILQDMQLENYGLHVYNREPEKFHPFNSGKHLLFSNDLDRTLESIGRISRHDAVSYPAWNKFWADAGEMFAPYLLTPPPTFGEFARRFEGTAQEDLFNKLVTGTARGIVGEFFESNEMKAATVSTYDSGSTDAPGALLYWAFHASVSNQLAAIGKVGYPRGGMGAVATALRKSAEAAGAEFRTNAGVARTIIHDNQAVGVELEDGSEISARVILSNADPRKTFLKLVGSDDLEPDFTRRVRRLHADAGYMKLHCAAGSLPDWTALPGEGRSRTITLRPAFAAVRTCWTAPGPPPEPAACQKNIRSRSCVRRFTTPLRRQTASTPFRFGSNLCRSAPMARVGMDSATRRRQASSARSRNSPRTSARPSSTHTFTRRKTSRRWRA